MVEVRDPPREGTARWDVPDPALLAALPADASGEDLARLYFTGDPDIVNELVRLVGPPDYGAARTHASVQAGVAGKLRMYRFDVTETPAPPGGRFDDVPPGD